MRERWNESKKKKNSRKGEGRGQKETFFLSPLLLPNFFVLEIGSRKGLLRRLGFS